VSNCPGCLKEGRDTYCPVCQRKLFDGKKVPHVLTFSRPSYNQKIRESSAARMSISGIQTKISLVLRNGQLEMTDTGGQYILKPIPHGPFENLDATPINEHLTMQIAHQVFGISVAQNAMVTFADGEPAYLVRRFDIQEDGQRLLQEDFAQLASRSEETHGKNYKYEFSYEEIAELIVKHVSAAPVYVERFFELVGFNYLIHNGDAHLKNFSIFRNEKYGGYTLTPAYDLLNTRLHVANESRMALSVFKDAFETDSFRANGFYAYDDFRELAARLKLRDQRFNRIMRAFVDREKDVISLIDRSTLSDECKRIYKNHLRDSIQGLAYSYANSQKVSKGDDRISK
jgi:serine/threonine-protein kinase HipA